MCARNDIRAVLKTYVHRNRSKPLNSPKRGGAVDSLGILLKHTSMVLGSRSVIIQYRCSRASFEMYAQLRDKVRSHTQVRPHLRVGSVASGTVPTLRQAMKITHENDSYAFKTAKFSQNEAYTDQPCLARHNAR